MEICEHCPVLALAVVLRGRGLGTRLSGYEIL